MAVHKSALNGFKKASLYEKYRPSYTRELVNHVIISLHTGSEQTTLYDVLELGTGTGKFTGNLLQQLKKPLRYLATEPVDSLLRHFKRLYPNIEVQQCDAAHISLPDNSVQNIICAQCFHWFANKNSLDDMFRVLITGGRLLCIWTLTDLNTDWVDEVERILKEYYDKSNTPIARERNWKDILERYQGFQLREHSFLPGIKSTKGSKAFVVEYYATYSVVAMQKEKENAKVRDKIKEVLDKYFDDNDEITIPFFSECYFMEKVK